MRFEFHREDAPETVVATAVWRAGQVEIASEDPALRDELTKVFRRTPLVVDDASYRRQGTHGAVLVQPGDLEWFRAVAQVRASAEAGLAARFVPGVTEGGYDPAADYRTFDDSIEQLTSRE